MKLRTIIILGLLGITSGCGKSPAKVPGPPPEAGPAVELGDSQLRVTGFAKPTVLNELYSERRPKFLRAAFHFRPNFTGRIQFFERKLLSNDCGDIPPDLEYTWTEKDDDGNEVSIPFKTETELSVKKNLRYVLRVKILNPSACRTLYYGFSMTIVSSLN
ncbi:MAG: hypothetical protein AABZ55_14680 [Bdellovibrionota bacterium]